MLDSLKRLVKFIKLKKTHILRYTITISNADICYQLPSWTAENRTFPALQNVPQHIPSPTADSTKYSCRLFVFVPPTLQVAAPIHTLPMISFCGSFDEWMFLNLINPFLLSCLKAMRIFF